MLHCDVFNPTNALEDDLTKVPKPDVIYVNVEK